MEYLNIVTPRCFYRGVFVLFTVLALVFSVIQAIMCIPVGSYMLCFELFVNAVCVVHLAIAFKRHETKAIRGLIGAILMLFLVRYADVFFDYVVIPGYSKITLISSLITPILIAIVMVNHFVVSNIHGSSPARIRFNQVMLAIMLIYIIVRHIYMIIYTKEMFDKLAFVVAIFSFICTFGVIICIETHNDEYRIRKEKGELTDEDKGWKTS